MYVCGTHLYSILINRKKNCTSENVRTVSDSTYTCIPKVVLTLHPQQKQPDDPTPASSPRFPISLWFPGSGHNRLPQTGFPSPGSTDFLANHVRQQHPTTVAPNLVQTSVFNRAVRYTTTTTGPKQRNTAAPLTMSNATVLPSVLKPYTSMFLDDEISQIVSPVPCSQFKWYTPTGSACFSIFK